MAECGPHLASANRLRLAPPRWGGAATVAAGTCFALVITAVCILIGPGDGVRLDR